MWRVGRVSESVWMTSTTAGERRKRAGKVGKRGRPLCVAHTIL
jgi:hypothetical protein